MKDLRFWIFQFNFSLLGVLLSTLPRVRNWSFWLHSLILFTIRKGMVRSKLHYFLYHKIVRDY